MVFFGPANLRSEVRIHRTYNCNMYLGTRMRGMDGSISYQRILSRVVLATVLIYLAPTRGYKCEPTFTTSSIKSKLLVKRSSRNHSRGLPHDIRNVQLFSSKYRSPLLLMSKFSSTCETNIRNLRTNESSGNFIKNIAMIGPGSGYSPDPDTDRELDKLIRAAKAKKSLSLVNNQRSSFNSANGACTFLGDLYSRSTRFCATHWSA